MQPATSANMLAVSCALFLLGAMGGLVYMQQWTPQNLTTSGAALVVSLTAALPVFLSISAAKGYIPCLFRSRIHKAAENGDTMELARLIDNGVYINQTNIYGTTPLHLVITSGSREALKLLLKRGAKTKKYSREKNMIGTPLHLAAYLGKTELVRLLCEAGADMNECGGRVTTPVNYEQLTPLQCAALMGHVSTVRILLERGVDIKKKGTLLSSCTAKELASRRGHAGVVQLLTSEKKNRRREAKLKKSVENCKTLQ